MPSTWLRRPVSTITASDVHELLAGLLAGGFARSIVTRMRVTLPALFEYAVSEHVAPANPVRSACMPVAVGLPARPRADTWKPEETSKAIQAQKRINPAMADVTEFLRPAAHVLGIDAHRGSLALLNTPAVLGFDFWERKRPRTASEKTR